MNNLLVAFASDDGKALMNMHFGDARKYLIYRISASDSEFVKEIANITEEDDEHIHADPRKAGSITQLLKQEKIQVVVSKIFGPNIKRIKTKFVCILMKNENISKNIPILQNHFTAIQTEWKKGEERDFLKL